MPHCFQLLATIITAQGVLLSFNVQEQQFTLIKENKKNNQLSIAACVELRQKHLRMGKAVTLGALVLADGRCTREKGTALPFE